MSAINNLKGHIVKDGKVVYSEEIENGLIFAVVIMYEPYSKSSSSQLICEAIMTNGNKHTWSNGVISLDDAFVVEKSIDGKFTELRKELKSRDGFRIWQSEEFNNGDTRKLSWKIEVPKNDLLKYCGT